MVDFARHPHPVLLDNLSLCLKPLRKFENFEYQMNYVYVKRLLTFRLAATRLLI